MTGTTALLPRFLPVAAAAAALAFPQPARAQTQPENDRQILTVGGGVQFLPAYPGAEEVTIQPLFTGGLRREGEPIPARSPDDGFAFSFTGRGGAIELGPVLHFQNERREEDVGAPVGEVDFTVEAGGFISLNVGPNLRLRAEARRGIGGHESFLGDIGADLALRPGDSTVITIGPRLRLNDDDYLDTYFGVTPAAALASGLPAYDPEGALRAVGVIAGLTHEFGRTFGIYAYAGYDRLIGDAADSPIVQAFGSEDQFSAGIALTLNFSVGGIF